MKKDRKRELQMRSLAGRKEIFEIIVVKAEGRQRDQNNQKRKKKVDEKEIIGISEVQKPIDELRKILKDIMKEKKKKVG